MLSRIKSLCAEQGLSLFRLEKQCGIGNGTIGKWGKEGRQPNMAKLTLVAEALGVSVSYLLTGEEEQKKPTVKDDELMGEEFEGLSDEKKEIMRQINQKLAGFSEEQLKAFRTILGE